jgi:hypothetical protein
MIEAAFCLEYIAAAKQAYGLLTAKSEYFPSFSRQ